MLLLNHYFKKTLTTTSGQVYPSSTLSNEGKSEKKEQS